MDNFSYKYEETLNSGNNNRLSWVDDLAGASLYADADIDNSMNSGNYEYDKLGQLISDEDEGIESITWRYGDKKMSSVQRSSGVTDGSNLEFIYNPFGQRIIKLEKPIVGGVGLDAEDWIYTYYSYDANGQVMAVYTATISGEENNATLSEQHIYGASRLGMIKADKLLYDNGDPLPEPGDVLNHTSGIKYYELANYLGNVEAVVTDRKTWNNTDDLYEAVVINTADYYPFGMLMPDRHTQSESYRYAYNGMETDNEIKGNGNSYTTEFRQYDPRLGRWLSLDPLMHQFPWMSPYVAFDNNPIYYTDPLGLASTNGNDGDPPKEGDPPKADADGDVTECEGCAEQQVVEVEITANTSTGGTHVALSIPEKQKNTWSVEVKVGEKVFSQKHLTRSQAIYWEEELSRQAELYHREQLQDRYFTTNWLPRSDYMDDVGIFFNAAIAAPFAAEVVAVGVPYLAPYLWQYATFTGATAWRGAKLYHNTFGKKGGYANMVLDAGIQELSNPGGDINYYSLVGAGFLSGNGWKKVAVFELSTSQIKVTSSNGVELSVYNKYSFAQQSSSLTMDSYSNSKFGTPFLGMYGRLIQAGMIGQWQQHDEKNENNGK